jgi:predicted DNA-binding antitoxin AbrB/MazE fold protein
MTISRTALPLLLAFAIAGGVFAAEPTAAAPVGGAPAAAAAAAPVVGHVGSFKDNVLTVKIAKEKEPKTFTLTDATVVTVDGVPAKAVDLVAGEKVTVNLNATGSVLSVAAEAKKPKKEKKEKKKD